MSSLNMLGAALFLLQATDSCNTSTGEKQEEKFRDKIGHQSPLHPQQPPKVSVIAKSTSITSEKCRR
jgi:hypothetical protein